jgi:hypothetical protein
VLLATASSASAATLFSDDFESGLSQWFVSDSSDVSIRGPDGGHPSKYVRIEDDAYIQANIDTQGYDTVKLTYERDTDSLKSGEYLIVNWRVGTSGAWTNLETVGKDATWQTKTWDLVGAEDKPVIQIYYKLDDDEGDYGLVDNVEVNGEVIGGGNEEIPEFSTIALPAASILGLLFFFNYRKRRKE